MKLLYVVVLIISISHTYTFRRLYEGSNCKYNGVPGLCKRLTTCPQALKSVERLRSHNFPRCGFTNDDEEIVCCADLNLKMVASPLENKSEMACKQYHDGKVEKFVHTVTGGQDANENEFPHMVALAFNRTGTITHECGGSLISDRFVLTAAHCFAYDVIPSKVRLGVTNLSASTYLDVDMKNYTTHPLYDTRTKYHDIALVELARRVKFSNSIRPACLHLTPDDPEGLQVTGWGQSSNNTYSDILQKAPLEIVPPEECNEYVIQRSFGGNSLNSTHQFCAIGKGRDSCDGDSGGPLQLERENGGYAVVGIVSHGPKSCSAQQPNSIYTRVSFYVQWIEKIVWGND